MQRIQCLPHHFSESWAEETETQAWAKRKVDLDAWRLEPKAAIREIVMKHNGIVRNPKLGPAREDEQQILLGERLGYRRQVEEPLERNQPGILIADTSG
jgi:hypothetical protein